MEYLEGETLAGPARPKGALPLDQALTIAIEIASALDTAHRAGIVHRDLKPGNIMLTKSRRCEAARLRPGEGHGRPARRPVRGRLDMLPTTPPNLTAQGTILGTFQYMAPEQLEGPGGRRAHRHLRVRRRALRDGHGQEGVRGQEPGEPDRRDPERRAAADLDMRQPLTPPALDRVVRTCLAKDPDDRWQSASDLRDELKWIAEGGATIAPVGARTRNRWSERVAWMTAAAGVLIALFVILRPAPSLATGDVVRLSILPPDKTLFTGHEYSHCRRAAVGPLPGWPGHRVCRCRSRRETHAVASIVGRRDGPFAAGY